MKIPLTLLALVLSIAPAIASENAPNTLTAQETQDGWKLLWDGKTSEGWRSAASEKFPDRGWTIKDGILTVNEGKGPEARGGGDIVTTEQYANFELKVDFKITPGANSGIKYLVQAEPKPAVPGKKVANGSAVGLEFQILDDELHPDAKKGENGNRTIASLYDLIPAASSKKPNPIGEWNQATIISKGQHVEHWLNGQKVVEYDRDSDDFHKTIAASKFKNIKGYGLWPQGRILLQDHGNTVSFRNVKIRVLPAK